MIVAGAVLNVPVYHIMTNWIKPGDVNFSREQMENFLLPNLSLLQRGEWPPEEVETGYAEIDAASIQHHSASTAYFTRACEIAAEIGSRLNQCGKYQRIIRELNCVQGDPGRLAQAYNLDMDSFNILWNKLLIYISGWRRKRVSFKRWVKSEVKI